MASPNELDLLCCQLAEETQAQLRAQQQYDEQKKRADEQEKRAIQAERDQAPTILNQYLQLVQQQLVSTLLIERNPNNAASGPVTSVDRKFYPLELYTWAGFEEEHNQLFNQYADFFSNTPCFPSKNDVLSVRRELSPASRKDEQDIRPFIRSSFEKPATRIVNALLELNGVEE